jgi:ribosomal protein S18 acetylase RimI-like enzyme
LTAIRRATAADRPQVERCVAEAYAKWVPLIGRRPAPMDADYATHIAREEVSILEDEGHTVGVVVLIEEPDHLLIENVAVFPEFQGRGHGHRLLEFAEQSARAAGYREVRLYTNVKMTENIALYARVGYEETERRVEVGYSRVFMSKRLS